MFVKTLQILCIPEEKNTIFVNPEFSRWPLLLFENKRAIQNLPNLPESRRELLKIAGDYTQTIQVYTRFSDSCENIIVTGHQAMWHHCGVLAKDIITSRFAHDVGGNSIHLVLDHDICDTAVVLPKYGNDGRRHFERIEIEREEMPVPLEFKPAPQREEIETFLETITQVAERSFCSDVWSKQTKLRAGRDPAFRNIANFITCFQAMLNSRLGINMMYLPVSQLSESDAFADFTTSIIVNASDFASSYNDAISQQIVDRKIKRKETIRPLVIDSSKGITELPFWLILPQGKREPLYVTSNETNEIRIGTASTELGNLDSSYPGSKTEQLKSALGKLGCRLRPKAVSLTLFVRLFLGDWFVHGVGGTLYEYITDYILENYYEIKGLNFGVATATAVLPLFSGTKSTQEGLTELKQRRRDLKYNPERFVDESLRREEPVKSLIANRDKLIRTANDRNLSAEEKKTAWNSISEVNEKLLKYAESSLRKLDERIKLSKDTESSQHVRDCREYFFGLFPEEILRNISKGETAELKDRVTQEMSW